VRVRFPLLVLFTNIFIFITKQKQTNKMKKVTMIFAAVVMFAVASCGAKKTEEVVAADTVVVVEEDTTAVEVADTTAVEAVAL